jgi:hypothetical protein
VFFESHPTKGLPVVDASSANPGIANVRPIPVDSNHIDICKPSNRNALVYGQILRFVRDLTDQAEQREEHSDSRSERSASETGPDVPLLTANAAARQIGSSQAGEHILISPRQVDLVIRPTSCGDGSATIAHEIGGETFVTRVELREVSSLLSPLRTDFIRRTYRFGGGQQSEIEHMAVRAFGLLLPSSVRMRLRSNEIRRVQVVADHTDPCLPWELLHDGTGFVAPRLPGFVSPTAMKDTEVPSPVPSALLVIEGVPSGGIGIDDFLRDHFATVMAGRAHLTRVTARNRDQLRAAVQESRHDAIHFACHTSVDPDRGVTFHLGEEAVGAKDMRRTLGGQSRLTYLSGCETATAGFRTYSYMENAAYLLSAALQIHTIGAAGWLDLGTSTRFEESFYANLNLFRNVEAAITRARLDLYSANDVGWSVLSLVGPKVK